MMTLLLHSKPSHKKLVCLWTMEKKKKTNLMGVFLAPGGRLAAGHVNLITLSSSSVNWGLSNGMSGATVNSLFFSFVSSVTVTSANEWRPHSMWCHRSRIHVTCCSTFYCNCSQLCSEWTPNRCEPQACFPEKVKWCLIEQVHQEVKCEVVFWTVLKTGYRVI